MTGSGTQASPYIISTLADLQALPALVNEGQLSKYYAELANDIDGKYRTEWETFSITTTSDFDFDLKGHSIKNFKSTGERKSIFAFNNNSYYTNNASHKMHNGSILNFKNDQNLQFVERGFLVGGQYEDLSISAYIVKHWRAALDRVRKMDRCAINFLIDEWYGQNSLGRVMTFQVHGGTAKEICNLSDFKVIIKNICDLSAAAIRTRGLAIFGQTDAGGNVKVMKNCRLQGEIQTLANDSLNQYPMISDEMKLENCVISFGLPAYTGSGTVVDAYAIPVTSTGVVNSSLVSDFEHYMFPVVANMPRLTDANVRSYIALNAAGFDVELDS